MLSRGRDCSLTRSAQAASPHSQLISTSPPPASLQISLQYFSEDATSRAFVSRAGHDSLSNLSFRKTFPAIRWCESLPQMLSAAGRVIRR
jgi:hypothetical protein